jgi:hypothetical protein
VWDVASGPITDGRRRATDGSDTSSNDAGGGADGQKQCLLGVPAASASTTSESKSDPTKPEKKRAWSDQCLLPNKNDCNGSTSSRCRDESANHRIGRAERGAPSRGNGVEGAATTGYGDVWACVFSAAIWSRRSRPIASGDRRAKGVTLPPNQTTNNNKERRKQHEHLFFLIL